MGEFRRFGSLLALALIAAAAPARADFHMMLIVEFFSGSAAAPDAQYVVLQMHAAGQSNLAAHPMRFFNASGQSLGTASFGTISNDADDARILIATSTAEALFGLEADLQVPVELATAGGKVCFDTVDCFAWGTYSPDDATVGTPFSELAPGAAARRAFTPPLDATDDTNDCEDDFVADDPAPVNNAGEVGEANPDAVFLDGFDDGTLNDWSAFEP